MTAQPVSGGCEHPLTETLDDAHDRALAALAEGKHLDAVVWLSAHVAAGQRAVHHAARNLSGVARLAVTRARAADHDLEVVLRRAEQRYSGDSLAAQLDTARLERDLRNALDRHALAECELVTAIADQLGASVTDEVAASYDAALRHAPTRPHPHVPHRGLLGAVAFRVDAMRDRVMDTMDARHVPSPRVERRRRPPGRWGLYLLGEMER